MKRALISVSNKEGIVEFARGLEELGYEIISTGGTYKTLQEAGIAVKQVADITGFPEIMDGRVKTLHPAIHGGILARRDVAQHMEQLQQNQIEPIDIVVVNLYPFRETISKPGVTKEEAIENIDIGGPSMVRAAAKNYQHVVVIVKPENYTLVLEELRKGEVSQEMRLKLALEAFSHTAAYDSMIAAYLSSLNNSYFNDNFILAGEKVYDLRYGENPHQQACFYRNMNPGSGLADAKVLNGKELSYNNIIDTEAAWELVKEFDEPACAIIKHTNPCGIAIADTLEQAYTKAFACDPVSAFGGIIAFNRKVDLATADKVVEPFMEVVIAPGYDDDALKRLQTKKNLRVLELAIDNSKEMILKTVSGGFVIQEKDTREINLDELQVVTDVAPSPEQLKELAFAWKVVKHVKSNAIVVTRDGMGIGIGAGQMNRVGSAEIALKQAGDKAKGAVMASDAFFPFKDTVEMAARYGISAIIQPGGSIRDQESIDECNRHGIAMVFTGVRHFRH